MLYVDFDGTVRKGHTELGKWVNTKADVEVFEQVPELLVRYKRLGWRIVGVTNQGGVALGHLEYHDMMAALAETSRQCKHIFDDIQFCIHHPDSEDLDMAKCWCRKPRAGMVVQGALRLQEKYPGETYPPHLALFVGDRPEDQQCAQAANIDFLQADLWRTGRHLTNLESVSGLKERVKRGH